MFDALREHLDDESIMEFTYITMMYSMHAVISRALRLEFDDRDDPIVEIAARRTTSRRTSVARSPSGWTRRSPAPAECLVGTIDTELRALCDALFDAIERGRPRRHARAATRPT